jgi:hypothetical protein
MTQIFQQASQCPTVDSASQIDMLRALVIDKFNEAAQLGLQNLPTQEPPAPNPASNPQVN